MHSTMMGSKTTSRQCSGRRLRTDYAMNAIMVQGFFELTGLDRYVLSFPTAGETIGMCAYLVNVYLLRDSAWPAASPQLVCGYWLDPNDGRDPNTVCPAYRYVRGSRRTARCLET